jgi:hypothetical protein
MLGIQFAESKWTPPGGTEGAYLDAVGDISGALLGPYATQAEAQADLDKRIAAGQLVPKTFEFIHKTDGVYIKNKVYGPSVGGPQIRTMRDPSTGNYADTFRDAAKLHDDPDYQARAAWEISKHGTDFTPWSTFVHNNHLPYKGKDYTLRRGHPRAADWSK